MYIPVKRKMVNSWWWKSHLFREKVHVAMGTPIHISIYIYIDMVFFGGKPEFAFMRPSRCLDSPVHIHPYIYTSNYFYIILFDLGIVQK